MTDATICHCKCVRWRAIVTAMHAGARDLQIIMQATGACPDNRCTDLNPIGRCF